jgi:TP901 family phage tail tape measure protein
MDNMGSSAKRFGGELSGLGSSMTHAFTIPILGVGVAAAKMAMDFQQSMTYVRTDAGDTTDNIDQLGKSVLNLAKVSQFSPDVLANGLYHLASLGLRGADAMNALNTAQQMAAVGGADLESTTTALGGALVTGIKGVQDYASAAGTLDAIIGAGNMRMQDLVGAIGTGVLPVFKNAGLTLTDFGAALATLTDNGQQADAAATHLRMTIALMQAPSQKATGILKELGMTQNQLGMDMQTKGLIPALQDLKKHLLDTYGTTDEGRVKMAQALTEMFGGGKSSAAIQTLVDQLDRVGNKYNQIGQQSGEFANKVAEQQATAAAKMKTAWSSVQAGLIQLGERILPVVAQDFTMLVAKIDQLGRWWNNLSQQQQHMIEKTLAFIAVTGPLLSTIGKISTGLGALLRVTGGLATGVGKLAVRFGASEGALLTLGSAMGPVGLGLAALGVVAAVVAWHFAGQKTNAEQLGLAQRNLKADTDKLHSAQDNLAQSSLNLEGAQIQVKVAQQNYNDAVSQFGPDSLQAQQALHDLKQAQQDLKTAQDNTKTSQQQLHDTEAAVAKDGSLVKHLQDIAGTLGSIKGSADVASAALANLRGDAAVTNSAITNLRNNASNVPSNLGGSTSGLSALKAHATGTNYAPGGLTLVGEKGPELVQMPRGSQVKTNDQTKQMMGGSRTVNIGTIILGSADAVKEMFSQLDRDNILVSKGLSPARGM